MNALFLNIVILAVLSTACGLKTLPQSNELDYRPAIPFKAAKERPKK